MACWLCVDTDWCDGCGRSTHDCDCDWDQWRPPADNRVQKWAATTAGIVVLVVCMAPGWWKWAAAAPVATFNLICWHSYARLRQELAGLVRFTRD